MRWIANTTTMPERSRRVSADRLQLAVGRRGLGPRDQEEHRTQRVSFVTTYHTKVRSKQHSVTVLGTDAWFRKCHMRASRPD